MVVLARQWHPLIEKAQPFCGALGVEFGVLHLGGSRLRPATAALANGGVRVWPTSLLPAKPETFIIIRFYTVFSCYLVAAELLVFPLVCDDFQESCKQNSHAKAGITLYHLIWQKDRLPVMPGLAEGLLVTRSAHPGSL
jgi:hypothetical protein